MHVKNQPQKNTGFFGLPGARGAEEKKKKRRTYLPTFFEIF
jgi:hypothetical protein